jgi:hypothetical protein
MITRELAAKVIAEALAHHAKTTRLDKDTTDQMLAGLLIGINEVSARLLMGSLRTNDLHQLIACALDCLCAGTWDAVQRGEKPLRPDEVEH